MKFEFKKIKVSRSSTAKLTVLVRRTGITANLLSRIALCLSLEDPTEPTKDFDDEGKELNRYSLTGKWDDVYSALLTERFYRDGIQDEDPEFHLKAHLNRGISMLHSRVKTLHHFLLILRDLGHHITAST